jgi:hypothetical protein
MEIQLLTWTLGAALSCHIHTPATSPRYPLDRKMGGPLSRSGRWAGNWTPTVCPLVHRYTELSRFPVISSTFKYVCLRYKPPLGSIKIEGLIIPLTFSIRSKNYACEHMWLLIIHVISHGCWNCSTILKSVDAGLKVCVLYPITRSVSQLMVSRGGR